MIRWWRQRRFEAARRRIVSFLRVSGPECPVHVCEMVSTPWHSPREHREGLAVMIQAGEVLVVIRGMFKDRVVVLAGDVEAEKS